VGNSQCPVGKGSVVIEVTIHNKAKFDASRIESAVKAVQALADREDAEVQITIRDEDDRPLVTLVARPEK
jgi:hypothetical protein